MPPKNIRINSEDVHAELNKLRADVSELPSDAVLRQVEGARTSVGGMFTNSLTSLTEAAAAATRNVAQEVLDSDSAVRAALEDLLGLDQEVASGADQVDTSTTSDTQPGTDRDFGQYGGPAYHNRV